MSFYNPCIEEKKLINKARTMGFRIPIQFSHWIEYFQNKHSFLKEFERWIGCKMANPKAPVIIATDILEEDEIPFNKPNQSGYSGGWGWDDEAGWGDYYRGMGRTYKPGRALPLTPTHILAPDGTSGIEHVAL